MVEKKYLLSHGKLVHHHKMSSIKKGESKVKNVVGFSTNTILLYFGGN
jgi:hypothetical protein